MPQKHVAINAKSWFPRPVTTCEDCGSTSAKLKEHRKKMVCPSCYPKGKGSRASAK